MANGLLIFKNQNNNKYNKYNNKYNNKENNNNKQNNNKENNNGKNIEDFINNIKPLKCLYYNKYNKIWYNK